MKVRITIDTDSGTLEEEGVLEQIEALLDDAQYRPEPGAVMSGTWVVVNRQKAGGTMVVWTAKSGSRVTRKQFATEAEADGFDWEKDFQFAVTKAMSSKRVWQ